MVFKIAPDCTKDFRAFRSLGSTCKGKMESLRKATRSMEKEASEPCQFSSELHDIF